MLPARRTQRAERARRNIGHQTLTLNYSSKALCTCAWFDTPHRSQNAAVVTASIVATTALAIGIGALELWHARSLIVEQMAPGFYFNMGRHRLSESGSLGSEAK
jgi:hypothetical protein